MWFSSAFLDSINTDVTNPNCVPSRVKNAITAIEVQYASDIDIANDHDSEEEKVSI